MNKCEELVLLAELGDRHCHLNHGPGVEIHKIPASDYIILPIGVKESEIIDETKRMTNLSLKMVSNY